MKTVAFFDVHPWEEPYLKEKLKGYKCLFFEEQLAKKHLPKIKNIDAISTFIHSPLPMDIITQLPKCKIIAQRATGFDNIDLAAATKAGMSVCTVPFYGENTVAEHAFGLLLSLSRQIHKSYVRSKHHNYELNDLTGFDLSGKTAGVIGGGHIGMHFVRMARGFNMKVLVYDVHPNEFLAETLGFEYVPLATLLKKSDAISIHVPYNKFTHHIINMDNIKTMKPDCTLINTARGKVVCNRALRYGLKHGIIGRAGLDVLEGEEVLTNQKFRNSTDAHIKSMIKKNQELIDMPNVLFTPHNAFNSTEALYRILDTTIENVKKGLAGKPQHKVN